MAEEQKPDENENLIIVRIVLPHIEYLGLIDDDALRSSAPLMRLGKAVEFSFENQGNRKVPRTSPVSQFGATDENNKLVDPFWHEDIYIPRGMATIYILQEGCALWNLYRQLTGSRIQVARQMPPGMPPMGERH